MNSNLPFTVGEWHAACISGSQLRDLLLQAHQKCIEMPAGIWIELINSDQLETQISALEKISNRFKDKIELLRAFPLFGVPFAVKDNINVAGFTTSAACEAFAQKPDADATVVARLKAAGAVCLGKTNLDQFATGLVGTRSPYGRPTSVFSENHVSGGSSSGSAVCVARGAVTFSLGTDTAGSGRIPAGFNQIVGLKPTRGRVSTTGVLPACRSLDCVSIFTHTVNDAGHVLRVIEGYDSSDSYSTNVSGPDRLPSETLRIGVPINEESYLCDDYKDPWINSLARLRSLGHEIVPVDFSVLLEIGDLLYNGPWIAERYAVVEDLLEKNPDDIEPVVRKVIERSRAFNAVDTFKAQYKLKELSNRAAFIFKNVDLIAVPTAPCHPTFDDLNSDPINVNATLGRYTNFVNLLGWCALAVPAGVTAEGLPFGITLIGGAGLDSVVLEHGRVWQNNSVLASGITGTIASNTTSSTLLRPASERTTAVAVVGAHLSGLPLNSQLTGKGAWLEKRTTTAPKYRFYALPSTVPPKPGLVRDPLAGFSVEVEIWQIPLSMYGEFVAQIPYPLGIGQIELEDGQWVQGFLCDPCATNGATDISSFGGWKNYLKSSTNLTQETV